MSSAREEITLDESGTLLGERYRLLRPLGEGGAGIVYAATDERIGAEVAIKVVRGSARRDEVTLARFRREARAAGKLGHPNIVRVTDVGTSASGSPYVVMERLEGETLEARIARGPLPHALAIDVHLQLSDALAAAHAAGVLHRDVKPANVFLTQLATGQVLVKLLDFGLAELYEEPGSPRLTERGLLVGSLAYLAPERIEGGPADERGDVYGVGVSLYESLTGELPFSAPNSMMLRAKILGGELPELEKRAPGLDPRLRDVVVGCTARDPASRIATAAEVRRRLVVAGEAPWRGEPTSDTTGRVPTTRSSSGSVRERPPEPPSAPVAPTVIHAERSRGLVVIATVIGLLAASAAAMALTAEAPDDRPMAAPRSETPALARAEDPSLPAAPVPSADAAPAVTSVPTAEPAAPFVASPPAPPSALPSRPPAASRRAIAPPPSPIAVPTADEAPSPTAEPSEPPTEPEGPTRFDRVLEPDWSEPLPR